MDNFIRPIGNAATKKVKKAFTKSEDILGRKYQVLSKNYNAKKIEKHGNRPIMVASTKLARSIRIQTNEKDLKISIFSNATNPEYLDHLTGDADRRIPQRKWFFTKEEEPLMLESEQLMKKEFDIAIDGFVGKIISKVIGSFRNIGEEIELK